MCKTCNEERTEQLVTRKFKGSYGQVTIHAIPASVCDCDEFLSLNTSIKISNFLNGLKTESEISHIQYEEIPK